MDVAPRTLAELLEQLAPELVNGHRPSWHDRAACVGSGVDYFSDRAADVEAARAICRGCTVAPQCGHYGADEAYGVWGGVAPAERGRGRRKGGVEETSVNRAGVLGTPETVNGVDS